MIQSASNECQLKNRKVHRFGKESFISYGWPSCRLGRITSSTSPEQVLQGGVKGAGMSAEWGDGYVYSISYWRNHEYLENKHTCNCASCLFVRPMLKTMAVFA